jgi:phosphinothricin acetyltransferase
MTLTSPSCERFHENLGIEKLGEFKDAGWKFDQWHDVGFWQKVLV